MSRSRRRSTRRWSRATPKLLQHLVIAHVWKYFDETTSSFRACRRQKILLLPKYVDGWFVHTVEYDLLAVRTHRRILDEPHRDAHLLGYAAERGHFPE